MSQQNTAKTVTRQKRKCKSFTKVLVDPKKLRNDNPLKNSLFYKSRLSDVLSSRKTQQCHDVLFTNEVKPELAPTDQKQTGTCWLMAGLNIIRHDVIKKKQFPKTFEFSKAHLYFWDVIEKCNYFLNQVAQTKELCLDDPLVKSQFQVLHSDGGTWSMFKNLVAKYGLMPSSVYTDDRTCEDSGEFTSLLSKELSICGRRVRDCKGDPKRLIQSLMKHLYKVVSTVMGEPPKKFTYRYTKDDALQTLKEMTPIEFRDEYCTTKLDDYVVHKNNQKEIIIFQN